MRPLSTPALSALLACLTAPVTGAQEILLEITDPIPDASIGAVIEPAGDVNGDGVMDLATTARGLAHPNGAVYLLSGADGAVVQRWDGQAPNTSFGGSVAAGSDLDGDGVADVLVAAPAYPDPRQRMGRVQAFSGRDGSVLYTLDGTTQDGWFGIAVDFIQDLDGDGVDELVVGSPVIDFSDPSQGHVDIYSGATGGLLDQIASPPNADYFGFWVSSIGDADGDGVDDIAVTSASEPTFIYSGATRALIAELTETDALRAFYPHYVQPAGDMDGDGLRDVLVSGTALIEVSTGVEAEPRLLVFSALTGAVLVRYAGENDDALGYDARLWPAGDVDVNGDGVPDLFGAGPGGGLVTTTGAVDVVSGRTGLRLYQHRSDWPDDFALGVVHGYGDANDDGFDDYVIGGVSTTSGFIRIHSGAPLFLEATPRDPVAGDTLTLALAECPAGDATLLALTELSGTPVFIPLFGIESTDANERRVEQVVVPPGLAGLNLELTAYALHGRRVVASAPETLTLE